MPWTLIEEMARLWSRVSVLSPLLPAILTIAGYLHWRRTRKVFLLLLTLGAALTFGGWTAEPVLHHLNSVNSPVFYLVLGLNVFLSCFGLILGTAGGVVAILACFTSRKVAGRVNVAPREEGNTAAA